MSSKPPNKSSSKESSKQSSGKSTGAKIGFSCTACKTIIKSTYNAHLHPLLDCLVCRACYINYGNGDFSSWEDGVDDNGDDNYCRWCCDGGELYGCGVLDKNGQACHYSFCHECIERNVPKELKNIGTDEKTQWFCFACDKTKLKKLREWSIKAMSDLNKRDGSDLNKRDSNDHESKKRKIEAPKDLLNKEDLMVRLKVFRKTKTACLSEIEAKFGDLIQMFTSPDIAKNPKRKSLISQEIAAIRETMMEFNTMTLSLEELNRTHGGEPS